MRYLNTLFLSFALLLLPVGDLQSAARSSFGGSRSSSFSAPKTSTFSAPKSSSGGWGTSSKPATSSPSKSTFGASSSPSTSSPQPASSSSSSSFFGSSKKNNSTDSALASKTATNSNTKSREQLVTEFKQQNAAKYTNKFDKEPSVRPSYIPPRYNDGGVQREVVYRDGSYGYLNAVGTFLVIDALTDNANRHVTNNYYSDGNGGYNLESSNSSGGSAIATVGKVLLFLLVAGGIVVAIVWAFQRSSKSRF